MDEKKSVDPSYLPADQDFHSNQNRQYDFEKKCAKCDYGDKRSKLPHFFY